MLRIMTRLFAIQRRCWVPVLTVVAILGGLWLSRSALPDPFRRLQGYAFDTLQRVLPRRDAEEIAARSGVIVVDIDEASLARYGQWPWSRSRVADLIVKLQDAGASAIGLDIVFAEPDRTSPAALREPWARDHRLVISQSGAGSTLPDYDRQLADAMARGRVVTGYGLLPTANGKVPVVANGVGVIGAVPSGFAGYRGAVPNLQAFDEAAAGQGSFTIAAPEGDEIIRRLPLFMTLNGALVPSLAMEMLRVASGSDDDLRIREDRVGSAVAGYVARVGEREIPIAADGTMWLHHGVRDPVRTWSAARVLDGAQRESLKAAVEGRLVLIGTSAVGLSDLRPTPLSAFEPGVDIHATAIEQMLSGDIPVRPFYAAGAEMRLGALLGLAIALVVALVGVRAGGLVLAIGVAGSLGGSLWAFGAASLLLDPSFVILAGGACFGGAVLARHLTRERQANRLRAAFGHYLSPQLVEALARDPDRLRLGGEEREMTFLFTDLEGFTSFTESVAPALLVSTLNDYLDGVCAIAMDHGGTIDKIVGDAVHVMFNAPLDQPDHAARAVRCGLAIDAFAQAFAADAVRLAAAGRVFGVTRIGINTGRAVVGNFGGRRRFDYTAHGDVINTAARLEAANKMLGTRICVARATVDAVGDGNGLKFRPIGELGLKGKARLVEVFAPAAAQAPETAWWDRYADAFALLSQGHDAGTEAVAALLAQYPGDPLLRFHAGRIERGQRGTTVSLHAA